VTDGKSSRIFDYVEHMLTSIDRVQSYVEGLDLAGFERSGLIQDAVIRNFEIIGEAANKIRIVDAAFAERHPQLMLDLAYRMRNALIHGYDAVNLTTLWNTIQTDLPLLKQRLKELPPG
jgi:uncharacterized protein with HEPN domain